MSKCTLDENAFNMIVTIGLAFFCFQLWVILAVAQSELERRILEKELDRLIENASYFDSFELKPSSAHATSRTSSYSIGWISFKFNRELFDLLDRLNSSTSAHIELALLNFTRSSQHHHSSPLFRTRLALFVDVVSSPYSNHSRLGSFYIFVFF